MNFGSSSAQSSSPSSSTGGVTKAIIAGSAAALSLAALYVAYRTLVASKSGGAEDEISFEGAATASSSSSSSSVKKSASSSSSSFSSAAAFVSNNKTMAGASSSSAGANQSGGGSSSGAASAVKKTGKLKFPYSLKYTDFPWGSDPTADKVQQILAAMTLPQETQGRRLSEKDENELVEQLMAAVTAMRKELCGYEKARLPAIPAPSSSSSSSSAAADGSDDKSNSISKKLDDINISTTGTAAELVEKQIGDAITGGNNKKKIINNNEDDDAATAAAAASRIAEAENMSERFDDETLRKRRVFAAALSDAAQGANRLARVKEAGELFFEACNAFRTLAYKNPHRDAASPDEVEPAELERIKHEDTLHAACLTSRGSFLEDLQKSKEALLCHKASVDICFLLFDLASVKKKNAVSNADPRAAVSGGESIVSSGSRVTQVKDADIERVDHPVFARCLNNMGALLFNMRQAETGMAMLHDALTMRRRLAGGLDSADLAESMTNIGMILVRSETKTEEGMNLMSVAVEMYKRVQGGLPSQVLAQAENALGSALLQTGTSMQHALQQMSSRGGAGAGAGAGPAQMQAQQQQRAMLEASQELIADGLHYKMSAVETLRSFVGGRPDPALCAILTEVGSAFGMIGQRKKALEYKLEATAIAEKLYAEDGGDESDSYQLATTYYSTGITQVGVDQKEGGVVKLRKALKIMRTLCAKPQTKNNMELHVQLANNLKVLGVTLENLGEKEEGAQLQKEAEDMKSEMQAKVANRSAASAALTAAASLGSHN